MLYDLAMILIYALEYALVFAIVIYYINRRDK